MRVLTYCGVWHDHHYIGVGCEHVDECREIFVADLHSLEGGCQFTTAQLELLDDVADLLEPMDVGVMLSLTVRNHLQRKQSYCTTGKSKRGLPRFEAIYDFQVYTSYIDYFIQVIGAPKVRGIF